MDSSSLSFLVGAIIAHGLIPVMTQWAKEWIAYFNAGEFNYDGLSSTADWCEIWNPGDGKWNVAKILGYSPPWFPGIGRVHIQVKSFKGVHEWSWRLTEWWAKKESLRSLSAEQQAKILSTGWPVFDGES